MAVHRSCSRAVLTPAACVRCCLTADASCAVLAGWVCRLLPYLQEKQVGIINASVLSMGLLTHQVWPCGMAWYASKPSLPMLVPSVKPPPWYRCRDRRPGTRPRSRSSRRLLLLRWRRPPTASACPSWRSWSV